MKITLNGKEQSSLFKTAFELRDSINKNAMLILNGFCIDKDLELKDGDSVVLIEKGKMPSYDELESAMMSRHTPNVHKKLKASKVAIAGLGGLGSNIAVSLARIGVGQLLLVDFDIVEPSNLNRQSYYVRHLGMTKTEALKEQIKEINPFIEVLIKTIKIDEQNIVELFEEYQIVCEAFDKADQKAMIVNGILEKLPNTTIIAASGLAGYDSSNLIQTRKAINNLYICGDLEAEAKIGNGLMAPRVQICAAHQANMVLRLLVGESDV
ncbi:sulfur carrier protein ThiS adenylyltransferase ThiF [Aliarcobacter thereius]|uniref:Sulfur carrier protein ThiS adenylyltransferase ThiF n=1 Tax=Aliarcobacter thereius TaxID=544718 RepID=A0A5R9H9F6_9BACT|nr:sulfur carrier protein ThiS adenylyltransferase ThiF [Aliarcobacter thereius]TLS72742.1 sulfur carrier protein ThiS adenylyltransferase ThiF [Aliarcobacter thereius]